LKVKARRPLDDKLKIVIGLRLPLAQAAEAHRRMEGRETIGKILLTVD
jgi:NADPH2:quinone reductase